MSSIIMRWLEEVFEHGWAYGSKGNALKGKKIIIALTAGSTNIDYQEGGKMGITEEEITIPLKRPFEFCKMNYLGTVFTGGMLNTGKPKERVLPKVEKQIQKHVQQVRLLIERSN